jgi:hypothetical protein
MRLVWPHKAVNVLFINKTVYTQAIFPDKMPPNQAVQLTPLARPEPGWFLHRQARGRLSCSGGSVRLDGKCGPFPRFTDPMAAARTLPVSVRADASRAHDARQRRS